MDKTRHIIYKSIALLSITISLIVIVSWIVGYKPFLSLVSDSPTMKFNTALGVFFSGICLLVPIKKNNLNILLAKGTAFLVLLIGFLSIIQNIFFIDLHIDNLFVTDIYSPSFPGRMADSSATIFILLGINFCGMTFKNKVIHNIMQYSFWVIIFISLLSIIAYVLDVPVEKRGRFLETMAIHTSVLFFLIAIGIAAKNFPKDLEHLFLRTNSGSRLIRLTIPFIVFLPIILVLSLISLYRNQLLEPDFGIVIYTFISILTGIIYVSVISSRLNKLDQKRNKLEGSLISSNQKLIAFKKALDASVIVFSIDLKGNLTEVNDKFCEISGYKPEELIGQPFNKFIPLEDDNFIQNICADVSQKGIWTGEIKNKTKTNEHYWIFATIIPFLSISQKIERYMGIGFNATQQKELQEKLKLSLLKEKKLGELKSHFVATTSHQFRTPMAIIQSNSELINMLVKHTDLEKRERLEKATERIGTEIKKMTTLMDDILILGKADSESFLKTNKTDTDIIRLCQELCEEYNSIQIDGRKVDFNYSGDAKVLYVDPKLIWHALSNFLSNALKYSKKKNPKLDMIFEQSQLTINISDNGIGIPEDDLPNLFQPFHRGSNTIGFDGNGLGLVIAKEYIAINEGQISVKSKLNQGTTFTILLPIT